MAVNVWDVIWIYCQTHPDVTMGELEWLFGVSKTAIILHFSNTDRARSK